MSDPTIEPAAAWLPTGLDQLRRQSNDEGIRIVSTVIDRWIDGTQLYESVGFLPVDVDGITHRLDLVTR